MPRFHVTIARAQIVTGVLCVPEDRDPRTLTQDEWDEFVAPALETGEGLAETPWQMNFEPERAA